MTAVSKKQKTTACMALAMKNGKLPATYSKAAKSMADSMSEKELETMCQMPMK